MTHLDDSVGGFSTHVVDSVLISKPVRSLDGIVPDPVRTGVLLCVAGTRAHRHLHVPSPIVLGHVTQRSIDTSLSGDGVTSRREELGDTSSLQSTFCQTESST